MSITFADVEQWESNKMGEFRKVWSANENDYIWSGEGEILITNASLPAWPQTEYISVASATKVFDVDTYSTKVSDPPLNYVNSSSSAEYKWWDDYLGTHGWYYTTKPIAKANNYILRNDGVSKNPEQITLTYDYTGPVPVTCKVTFPDAYIKTTYGVRDYPQYGVMYKTCTVQQANLVANQALYFNVISNAIAQAQAAFILGSTWTYRRITLSGKSTDQMFSDVNYSKPATFEFTITQEGVGQQVTIDTTASSAFDISHKSYDSEARSTGIDQALATNVAYKVHGEAATLKWYSGHVYTSDMDAFDATPSTSPYAWDTSYDSKGRINVNFSINKNISTISAVILQ